MKKILILSILFFTASLNFGSQTSKDDSILKKYLVPIEITQLDWILLKIQVSSFSQPIRWDDYDLVENVELFVASKNEKNYVGLTFLVNKEPYIRLENHSIKKIFMGAIESVKSIIEISIPEINLKRDIFANFVLIGGGIVAEYINGEFKFIE